MSECGECMKEINCKCIPNHKPCTFAHLYIHTTLTITFTHHTHTTLSLTHPHTHTSFTHTPSLTPHTHTSTITFHFHTHIPHAHTLSHPNTLDTYITIRVCNLIHNILTPTHPHTITPSHQPLRLTCTNGGGILSMITVRVTPVAVFAPKNTILCPITLHIVQPYLH